MKRIELNRRDFSKLTIAAFGGVIAGTAIGCGNGDGDDNGGGDTSDGGTDGIDVGSGSTDDTGSTDDGGGDPVAATDDSLLLSEPHVCRGMNACMNKGQSKENACAGKGTCHTLAEGHSCHGENACKGQGGCEETAGRNACDKKGNCNVPLNPDAWKTARAALKAALEEQGKTLGDAPES
jgi:hypothetical protein